jgi:hypothetical protein
MALPLKGRQVEHSTKDKIYIYLRSRHERKTCAHPLFNHVYIITSATHDVCVTYFIHSHLTQMSQHARSSRRAQDKAVVHEYVHNGIKFTSFHPPRNGSYVQWVRASPDTFRADGHDAYILASTDSGISGVLSTCKNCCVQFNSFAGCDRTRCHFFHVKPGFIMSNLPARRPTPLGKVAGGAARSAIVLPLLSFTCEQRAAMDFAYNRAEEELESKISEAVAEAASLQLRQAKRAEQKLRLAEAERTIASFTDAPLPNLRMAAQATRKALSSAAEAPPPKIRKLQATGEAARFNIANNPISIEVVSDGAEEVDKEEFEEEIAKEELKPVLPVVVKKELKPVLLVVPSSIVEDVKESALSTPIDSPVEVDIEVVEE